MWFLGILYLIGVKYTFGKILLPLIKYLQCNLNSGVFEKLIFENTIWPNYFFPEIIFISYTHGMIIGKKFGARKWSIEVGGFIWFLEHLQTADKNQIKQRPKHSKVFVKPHFIMIVSLSVVAWKSGRDRPTPLTRISSPRFLN